MSKQNNQAYKDDFDHLVPLTLNGSIGFDSEGRKILVNTKGKAFATNDQILEVWRELEKIHLEHHFFNGDIDDLIEKLSLPKEKLSRTKTIVSKLVSHELIAF